MSKPTAEDVAATVAEIRGYAKSMRCDKDLVHMHRDVFEAWAADLEAADARCVEARAMLKECEDYNNWMQEVREHEVALKEKRARIKVLESELEARDARCRALERAVASLTGALNGEPLEGEGHE